MRRRDVLVPLALYAAALAARLWLLDARPYGDEAHHYFVAREFGALPPTLVDGQPIRWLFWWRLMFSVLLVPGAQVSFTAFRVDYMLLTSLLPLVVWWWLRARGVRPVAAAGAGLVAALHPFFVVWGVRAFPDELMAVGYVGALALWERGRHGWSAAAWVGALWVKEVALIGLLVLCAEEALRAVRGWVREGEPLLDRRQLWLGAALALAWVPHWIANAMGGRMPGWSRGGSLAGVLDGAFTTVWLVPLVALALLSSRARRPALHALAYLGFFLVYTARGGLAEGWYFVLPALLAFCAAAALADAIAGFGWAAPASAPHRAASVLPALLVALLVVAQATLPAQGAFKDQVLHPATATREASWAEMARREMDRDQDLWTALAAATPADWNRTLAVDVPWFNVLWPLGDRAGMLGSFYTEGDGNPPAAWADLVESIATMMVLRRTPTPLNEALQATYEDCAIAQTPEYVVVRGSGCVGREGRLAAEWDARR